jgi:MFS superfamily sulfate permease-like transporter
METLITVFIYVWISVIAFIPNAFMGGLTICVVATLITYFERSKSN